MSNFQISEPNRTFTWKRIILHQMLVETPITKITHSNACDNITIMKLQYFSIIRNIITYCESVFEYIRTVIP